MYDNFLVDHYKLLWHINIGSFISQWHIGKRNCCCDILP